MGRLGREKPIGGFELFAWFFMRISGLALIVLAIGHLIIMHVINNVDTIDYNFVARRWATPFWRTYDMVLLCLALIHGLNGLRTVIDDYVHTTRWRMVSLSCLYFFGFVVLVIGVLVIFTFQPVRVA